jgi:hypothetical protein
VSVVELARSEVSGNPCTWQQPEHLLE